MSIDLEILQTEKDGSNPEKSNINAAVIISH